MKKKNFNRVISAIAALMIVIAATAVSAMPAAAAIHRGECGENVTWTLDTSTRVLTISGNGAMNDYASAASTPWYSARLLINHVNIEQGVTYIGKYAFCQLESMTDVSIAGSVKNIGAYAFQKCSGLRNIAFNYGVETIGEKAFYECTSLESIYMANSVVSLGKFTFGKCIALTDVKLSNNLFSIAQCAFYDCDSLTSIYIPDGVISLAYGAFDYSNNLAKVTLPATLGEIGEYAFYSCTMLKEIVYCGNEEQWKKIPKGQYWDYHISDYRDWQMAYTVTYHPTCQYDEGEVILEPTHMTDGKKIYTCYCGAEITEILPKYVLGDVSGDGKLTNSDALMMLRYIYNSESYPLSVKVGDVNFDGFVTNEDVLNIYKNIYSPELYPLG